MLASELARFAEKHNGSGPGIFMAFKRVGMIWQGVITQAWAPSILLYSSDLWRGAVLVALRWERRLKRLKMGSQHLPSLTFYAILDPLVRPSQSMVGLDGPEGWEDFRACVRARFKLRGGPILTFPGPKVWTPTILFLQLWVIHFSHKDASWGGIEPGEVSGMAPDIIMKICSPFLTFAMML